MIDQLPLAEILEKIRLLSGEIGPRPAGSSAERNAQQQLARSLDNNRLSITEMTFSYPTMSGYFPYLALIGLWFLLAALIPKVGLALLVVSPFVTGGLPELSDFLSNLFLPKQTSQNTLITPSHVSLEELDLLLVAHCDSARIQPSPRGMMAAILDNLMPIIEVISWFLAFCAIAIIVGTIHQSNFAAVIRWIAALVGVALTGIDLWQQLSVHENFSPGANDNASGVAVCTVLMGHLDELMSKPPKVGCLLTGAEEAGLYGSAHFARVLKERDSAPIIINVDMVGYGLQLGVVSRAGRLRPRSCDQTLINHLRQFDPDLHLLDYKYRAGDLVPFLKANLRTISLEMTNHGRIPSTYHSTRDSIDHIDPHSVQMAADVLVHLITTYPQYRTAS